MKGHFRILKAQNRREELVVRFVASYDKEAERKAADWARKHVPPGYVCLQCAPTPNRPIGGATIGATREPRALKYHVELRIRPSINADKTRTAALKREVAKLTCAPVQPE